MRTAIHLFLLAGCLDGSKPHQPTKTVDQGVYGVLTSTSDVAGQPDLPYADAGITAFVGEDVLDSVTSDADGGYALALPAGSYVLCTLGAAPSTLADQWQHNCAGKCTQVDVPPGALVADWAANLSGGLWDAGDHCPH